MRYGGDYAYDGDAMLERWEYKLSLDDYPSSELRMSSSDTFCILEPR